MKTLEQFPNYGFTELGEVFNLKFDRQLKPYVSDTVGYLYITLKKEDGKYRPTALHRIIGKLYIPNPANEPMVLHKDNNKLNPKADNLYWGDNRINIQQAYDDGLAPKGIERWNNVNPVEDIHRVCDLLQEGLLSLVEIAQTTTVNYNTIKQIKYRRQWKDISSLYKW